MRTFLPYGCSWVAALLLALGSLASPGLAGNHSAQQVRAPTLALCKSSDIEAKDLGNCDCPSNFPSTQGCITKNPAPKQCSYTCKPPPPSPAMSFAQLVNWGTGCADGCVDGNKDCSGCYLWFHSLCGCIKDLQKTNPKTNCLYTGSIAAKSAAPAWVVFDKQDKMTVTKKVPGILQVQHNTLYQDGFDFAQKSVYKLHAADGTLALNPAAHRSEEQIHIHLCNNKNSRVRSVLDGLHPSNYNKLAKVDLSGVNKAYAMMCRAASTKPIDMAKDIVDYLGQVDKSACARYQVGAGYMLSKGVAWSCVTIAGSAEDIFCRS
jgi:hypothetical protein